LKNTSVTNKASKKGKGVVQIAIWKDNPELLKMQDVFTNYSQDLFYDFSKPLHLLDSPGWSPTIRTESNEGFYVLSTNEKIY
jgi:hypothetical protein